MKKIQQVYVKEKQSLENRILKTDIYKMPRVKHRGLVSTSRSDNTNDIEIQHVQGGSSTRIEYIEKDLNSDQLERRKRTKQSNTQSNGPTPRDSEAS